MLKSEIRRIYSQQRLALSTEEFNIESQKIIELFRSRNWDDIKTLMSYYAIHERKEFEVAACEIELLRLYPEMIDTHPRISTDGLNMEAVIINKDSNFSINKFNIPEPQNGEIADPTTIDLVFVPLLAFDEKGYRVGYGKGFYDRFLMKCRPDTLKLGFSFFGPVPSIDDINQFDVPLDLCITPLRVYEF